MENFFGKKFKPTRSKVKELCNILVLRRKFIPFTSIYVVAWLKFNSFTIYFEEEKLGRTRTAHTQGKKVLRKHGTNIAETAEIKGTVAFW